MEYFIWWFSSKSPSMVFLFGRERDAYWRHWQWVGIQLTISTWPWIMNLFLGSLSCSLILTISLWQELFRRENWAMEKLYNLSRIRQVEPLHSYVYTDSQNRLPLWKGEGPSYCQASSFQWSSNTHCHAHTYTRMPQAEVLEQAQNIATKKVNTLSFIEEYRTVMVLSLIIVCMWRDRIWDHDMSNATQKGEISSQLGFFVFT